MTTLVLPIGLMVLFAVLFIVLEARMERRYAEEHDLDRDWRNDVPPSYRTPR